MISEWLPKLQHPIRTGERNNTAFGLGLMLDYARVAGNAEFRALLESRARDYYLKDVTCPLAHEPSGEDFLSPCLAEADAMRRVLPDTEFARWFAAFLPKISANALKTQMWTAPIAMLLLKYLHLKSSFSWSFSNLVALIRQQLFVCRDLYPWLNDPFQAPPVLTGIHDGQLAFGFCINRDSRPPSRRQKIRIRE